MSAVRELWGGAITSEVPTCVLDASDFRQVPDTQEVFIPADDATTTSMDSLRTEDSLIFDLMERIDGDDMEAIKEHFTEIATLNGAAQWELFRITECVNSLGVKAYVCVALEPALKWGRSEAIDAGKQVVEGDSGEYRPALAVVLGIVRLSNVNTDLLITYNAHFSNVEELMHLEELHHAQDEDQIAKNVAFERISYASAVVELAVKTLKVKNWELFG